MVATRRTSKKRTQLDSYTCGIIIGRFLAGQKTAAITREMKMPRSTIVDCINRWKKTGTAVIAKRQGRPLKNTEKE